MPALQRLELKSGTVYDLDKPWPGAPETTDKAKQLIVGPIFFRPELVESVDVGNSAEDEGNAVGREEDDDVGAETYPAYYEVWCVTTPVLTVFAKMLKGQATEAELAQVMEDRQGVLLQRRVYATAVAYADEQWPMAGAFHHLAARFSEIATEASAVAETSQGAESTGNGGTAQAGAPG